MKKKLKISQKIKSSVIVNGGCSYSLSGTCGQRRLCYKSPVPIKGNGLYVANDPSENV